MTEKPESHGLGFGNGSLIDHHDGSIEYRQTGKILPAFRVVVADIAGFSVRRVTRDDKKRLNASSLQQILTIQGSGTTLAEAAVNHGTSEKIEQWFRAHPDFGSRTAASVSPSAGSSVADELLKLVSLRDAGVLSPVEFDVQKARLLN